MIARILPFILAVGLHGVMAMFFLIKSSVHRVYVHPLSVASDAKIIRAFTMDWGEVNSPSLHSKTSPLSRGNSSKDNHSQSLLSSSSSNQRTKRSNLAGEFKKYLIEERNKELKTLKQEQQRVQRQLTNSQNREMIKMLDHELAVEKELLTKPVEIMGSYPLVHGETQGEVSDHLVSIHQSISSRWLKPENLSSNDQVKIRITIGAGGVVLDQRILSSTGNTLLERSAQAAIVASSPLPLDSQSKVFDGLRELIIVFKSDG